MKQTFLPINFNPLEYLILNKDVARRNADPFRHFLDHGSTEGRHYRAPQMFKKILCCIMKSEELYLLEWIAFHRNEGFTHLIIGDNGGSSQQTEVLRKLDGLGVIERVDLLGQSRPQIAFYNSILMRDLPEDILIGFIDTDEFLIPTEEDTLAATILDRIFADQRVGALGVNWSIFGSSNQVEYDPNPVVTRFCARAYRNFSPNRHVKTFVRAGAAKAFAGNPHSVVLNEGLIYVNTEGQELKWGPEGLGISNSATWRKLKLNHYILKSKAEFDLRKVRGSATSEKNDSVKLAKEFFQQFDKNNVTEKLVDIRIIALEHELERLRRALEGIIPVKNIIGIKPDRPPLTFSLEVSEFIKQKYTNTTSIVEYGSGGSTLIGAQSERTTIFSVESDPNWTKKIRDWLRFEPQKGKVVFNHVDIGPTKEGGFPQDETRRSAWINYSMSVWERGDLIHPDIVLVDGRFRVACFLATMMNIRRPTTVLFDDYTDRPHYHVVEEFFVPVQTVGRMAVFEVRPRALHPSELRKFASYFFNPE